MKLRVPCPRFFSFICKQEKSVIARSAVACPARAWPVQLAPSVQHRSPPLGKMFLAAANLFQWWIPCRFFRLLQDVSNRSMIGWQRPLFPSHPLRKILLKWKYRREDMSINRRVCSNNVRTYFKLAALRFLILLFFLLFVPLVLYVTCRDGRHPAAAAANTVAARRGANLRMSSWYDENWWWGEESFTKLKQSKKKS